MTSLPTDAAPYVDEWLGPGWTARPLAGDASVRAYYRVTASNGETYILAYYPEEVRTQLGRFLSAYDAIAQHGAVPEVLQHCEIAVLQRDAGDRTLFEVLHEDREEGLRLYRAAIDLLVAFQKAEDRGLNAAFTAEFFLGELQMAREFYVEKLMGADGESLQPLMKTICENVARHPYVLCHRDYHGQNLHLANDTLFLIDYQDLRMGPDTYDLASLLRDRGVARIIGDDAELEMLSYYATSIGADGDIRRRYFETLLQRSIKILGTFAKQPIVRGRMHYLDFIPATLESIRRCIEELPEMAALRDMFPLQFDVAEARTRAAELGAS
ncbi:MAG TPA: phosphotransferase [Thermoanaerobaculia bacterium]|nr:phosphotransferase [Thermoanaerobaculia bacterium]